MWKDRPYEDYGTGCPIDCDGYPKSRMPDSPPEMYHFKCDSCGKIWWDEKKYRDGCSFCGASKEKLIRI